MTVTSSREHDGRWVVGFAGVTTISEAETLRGLELRSPADHLRPLAADTFSIAAMEFADNTVMAVIPGAMNAGLVNPLFWITMPFSLAIGFVVAVPVNQLLLKKGIGAMAHSHHMMSHGDNHE